MRHNLRLLCSFLVIMALSGCTVRLSDQVLLGNQKAVSEYNYANELDNLSALYPQLNIEDIQLTQSDGNISKGIYVKQDNAEYTILYFGPNNFPILKQNNNVIPHLAKLNANIIWFDYRGFGFTSGEANIDVFKSDANHIYKSINEQVKGPLVLHGLSIGSVLAIDVASNNKVENLVIEGSTTTVEDYWDYAFVGTVNHNIGLPKLLGYLIKPFFPVEVSQEIASIDNRKALLNHKGPLLMLIGEKDWETPPALSKKLYDAVNVNEQSEFHIIEDVYHLNNLTSDKTLAIYKQFLENKAVL